MKVSEEIGALFFWYLSIFLTLLLPWPIALFFWFLVAMAKVADLYEVVATACGHAYRRDPYFRSFVHYLLGGAGR